MGSITRPKEYDKVKKIYGPRCHKCGSIMRTISKQMYGDTYQCDDCGAKFEEDWLP